MERLKNELSVFFFQLRKEISTYELQLSFYYYLDYYCSEFVSQIVRVWSNYLHVFNPCNWIIFISLAYYGESIRYSYEDSEIRNHLGSHLFISIHLSLFWGIVSISDCLTRVAPSPDQWISPATWLLHVYYKFITIYTLFF